MASSIMRQSRARRARRPAADPIQQLLDFRAGIVARQEFLPIGRIMQIHTAAGVIDFRNQGPAIGRLDDKTPSGIVDLVEPWPGAPPRYEATQDNCPDCLTKCDECKRGVRKCNHGRKSCGGSGKVKAGERPCRCVKRRKRPNPSCRSCFGSGSHLVMKSCEICRGKGKVKCPLCHGTAKMSTGRENGSIKREAANCSTCHGYGRKMEEIEQPLSPHITEREGVFVLGPIRGMLVMPLVGTHRMPQWWSATADGQGNPLQLVLRRLEQGGPASLLGGTMIVHNFTAEA